MEMRSVPTTESGGEGPEVEATVMRKASKRERKEKKKMRKAGSRRE